MEWFIRVASPIFYTFAYEFFPADEYHLEGASDKHYTFSYKGYKVLCPKQSKDFDNIAGQNQWVKRQIENI